MVSQDLLTQAELFEFSLDVRKATMIARDRNDPS
jgi:hypothetical protein